MIRAPPQLAKANTFNYRRMLSSAEVFYPLVVLLFTLVVLALCELCSVTGLGYQVEYDACRSYRQKSNSDIQDLFSGDVNSGFASENFEPHGSLDNVCRDSNLFCFWSRLPRLLSPEHVAKSTPPEGCAVQLDVTLHARSNDVRTNFSWSPELGIIKFCSGRTISYCLNCQGSFQELPCQHTESGEQNDATSCRGPLLYHKSQYFESQEDIRMKRPGILDSSSPHIEASTIAEADEMIWKSHATCSGMSVLDDDEVLFPVVQVGSHFSLVTVNNPSQQPVVMQLILHPGEIIAECKTADGPFQPSSTSSLIGDRWTSSLMYGFSISDGALTEALVHPYGSASLGPLLFQLSDLCEWRSSVLVGNNLSGVEWLSLRGFGGSVSMVLLEESELVQKLEFKLSLLTPHSFSSPDFLYLMEDNIHACSQPLSKELFAKNMGDFPLEVASIKVSGTQCRLDGFVLQTCKGVLLEPGKSTKLIVTYQTDFLAATVQRDLELALATGIFGIPMKASLPLYMLSFCKRTIFWTKVRKSIVAILLAASIFFLVLCCSLSDVVSFGKDCLFKGGKSSISTVSQAGTYSRAYRSIKSCSNFALSTKMNGLLRYFGKEKSLLLESVGRYHDGRAVARGQDSSFTAKPVNSNPQFDKNIHCFLDSEKEMTLASSSVTNPVAVESSDIQETLQAGNLRVKTGKDKGRRRRKKKSSANGVTALFELSSSQSGNSTPSSPLSPVSSLTPTMSRPMSPNVSQSVQARNPFAAVAIQQCERTTSCEPKSNANVLQSELSLKPCGRKNYVCGISTQGNPNGLQKVPGEPVLLPSATFPRAGRLDSHWSSSSSFLASASTIAPHSRAPGSKLHEQKTVKTDGKADFEEKFTYDIWGDHIFQLPLMDRSKEVSGFLPHATENNSDSFFVRGPQTLMTIAQPECCSDQVG